MSQVPSAYQFPVMPIDEAVESLNMLNSELQGSIRLIPGPAIKDADFKKPDPQKWRQIFEGLYELLTTVSFETTFQQSHYRIHVAETVEHPELHEESTRLCIFTLAMGRLLAECGISDFVMKDILRPTTRRLLKIVSGVLNFHKFQTSRFSVFAQLKEDVERQNVHFTQLKKDNEERRRKINSMRAAEAEQEPRILELQNKIRDKNDKMKEHYKSKAATQKTLSELKAGIAEKKAETDRVRIQIMETKKLGDKLSSQIVRSPERFKDDKKRMQAQISEMKLLKETKLQRRLELHEQAQGLKSLNEDVEQAQKMIRGIEAEDEKERECAVEIAKLQDQIQTDEEVIQALNTKETELDRLIHSKQEKIDKLSLQHQYKMAGEKETLAQLSQQVKLEHDQYSEQEEQRKQLYEQKTAISKELEISEKLHKKEMDGMQDAYRNLLEKLDGYHAKLATTWEKGQRRLNED